jgi:hypothetical protein
VRCEGPELSHFGTTSEWVTKCGRWRVYYRLRIQLSPIQDEPHVAPPLASQTGTRVVIIPCGDGWHSRTLVLCFNYKFNFNLLTFLCICKSWIDSAFDGTSKQTLINQVLGNLCHLHYPRMVTLPSDKRQITTTWEHFRYAPNGDYETAQSSVVWLLSKFFSSCMFFFITLVY